MEDYTMPNTRSSSSRGDSDSASTRARSNGHTGGSRRSSSSSTGSSRNSSSTGSSSTAGSSRSSRGGGKSGGSSRGGSSQSGGDSILRSASTRIRPVTDAVSSARRSISQRLRNLPGWTPYALGAIGLAALIYGAFQLDAVRDMLGSDSEEDLFSDYDADNNNEFGSTVSSVRSSVGNSF
jgi:hypothetical protein